MAEPSRPVLGYLLGAIAGFVLTSFLGAIALGAGGYAFVKQNREDARRGWNLVPVVVAADDLPAGSRVTFDQLAERPVPELLVTASVVKPGDLAHVVNQVLDAPVSAGEPLRWAALVGSRQRFWQCTESETAACSKDTPAIVETTNAQLRARLGAPR